MPDAATVLWVSSFATTAIAGFILGMWFSARNFERALVRIKRNHDLERRRR